MGSTSFGQEGTEAKPATNDLIGQLGDDSYHVRQSAARMLREAAQTDVSIQQALCSGLHHHSLEVREACRELIQALRQTRIDTQISQLLHPDFDPVAIDLPMWQIFSGYAGTDFSSRKVYVRLLELYPATLQQLASATGEAATSQLIEFANTFDPYHLAAEDASRWAMALLLDLVDKNTANRQLTSRLSMALSHPTLGPKTSPGPNEEVLRRLIQRWVLDHAIVCPTRERLLIAVRHNCRDLVDQLCDETFQDNMAPPATQVTAMLCAAVIARSDLVEQLKARLSDDRTAHVWQLIASRKTRIRTEVRDVALALLLQHAGIDPRKAGYAELQADPWLVFVDHSLGFPDEDERQQAIRNAAILLDQDDQQTRGK
jgi:hypothetical protein